MPKSRFSSQSDGDRLYTLEGRLIHDTPRAYLFQPKGSEEKIWFPKSQVELEAGLLTLPEWLLLDKKLDYLIDP